MLLFYFIIFTLGLTIGSFLNVVIFRLENGEKIVNDRSKCMNCGHILAWYDLFPVLSFLFLRGKCRYCEKKISWQYPLVELGTGTLFIIILNYILQINELTNYELISNIQYPILSLIFWFFITSSFIVIFVYDLKHYIIPDKVIYLAIAVVIGFNLFNDVIINNNSQFLNFLSAGILAGSFFLAIVLLTQGKGMGGGDVKLGFLMGLILGWPVVLIALFLSFILGSIVGIFLILLGKKKMKSIIPFGPFLVLGTFIAMFWGKEIVEWYINMII